MSFASAVGKVKRVSHPAAFAAVESVGPKAQHFAQLRGAALVNGSLPKRFAGPAAQPFVSRDGNRLIGPFGEPLCSSQDLDRSILDRKDEAVLDRALAVK